MDKDIKRGSLEAMLWLKDFSFNKNQVLIIQQIYDFRIYRKLIKCLSDDDIYELHKKTSKMGFTEGLNDTVRKMRQKVVDQIDAKELQLRIKEHSDKINKDRLEKELEAQIKEEERLSSLTIEQKQLRETPHPSGMRSKIPLEVITSQTILEVGCDTINPDIKYIVFDRVYQCDAAIIISPHRLTGNGKIGCVILRDKTHHGLMEWLPIELRNERKRQAEWEAIHGAKTKPKNNDKPIDTPVIDISKVRKYMGLDGNVEGDLSGGIF